MKIIIANNKRKIIISKQEWLEIGKLFIEAGGTLPTCKTEDFRQFLRERGFSQQPSSSGAGSHVKWTNQQGKTTGFSDRNESMIHPMQIYNALQEAGISLSEFKKWLEIHTNPKMKKSLERKTKEEAAKNPTQEPVSPKAEKPKFKPWWEYQGLDAPPTTAKSITKDYKIAGIRKTIK